MIDDRTWCNPTLPVKGTVTEIGYRGLLAQSGADRVYLHYGTDGWKNPKTVPMQRRFDGGFAVDILCNADKSVEFCFKDSADHWDNNSGWNWSVPVAKK